MYQSQWRRITVHCSSIFHMVLSMHCIRPPYLVLYTPFYFNITQYYANVLQKSLQMRFSLTFCPSVFRALVNTFPPLDQFLTYVRGNYINAGAPFPTALWNCYTRGMDCRTNNKIEGTEKTFQQFH